MKRKLNLHDVNLHTCTSTVKKAKSNNKQYWIIVLFLLVSLMNSYAQFIPGTVSPTTASIGSVPFKTGSDILDLSGDTYRVSTYDALDPDVPRIAYEVTLGSPPNYTGVIPLISYGPSVDYHYSDVCLVVDGGVVNALVTCYVYDNVNLIGGWILNDYYWDMSGAQFLFNSSTLLTNGSQGTDVNIDGDDQSGFAIIYDDGNNDIWFVTGRVNSGTVYIDNPGTPVLSNVQGYFPDLSIQNANGTYVINTSCLTSFTNLQINTFDYNEVITNSISTVTTTNMGNNAGNFPPLYSSAFGHPRFASPATISSSSPEWTVVVEEYDDLNRGQFDIEGYNSVSPTSVIPYISSPDPNSYPVITYDNTGNVWVGWILDNTSGSNATAATIYPIVASCNSQGAFNTGYYDVVDYVSTAIVAAAFSIASRNSGELFVTYYDYNNSYTFLTKSITSNTFANFRSFQNNDQLSLQDYLTNLSLNEESSGHMTFYLYNISGQLIIKQTVNISEIRNIIRQNLSNLPLSLYMAKIIADDGKVIVSDKVACG